MNFKIYLVIFAGVLIILFAIFSFFAVGTNSEQWGSLCLGAALGCLMAVGFRISKKKRLANKKT
ncbi:hypothetical protein [Mucilaginibacter phyllosphaerae]